MYNIGLCGPICAGKSTVAAFIRERNVPVIDSDGLGHSVFEQTTEVYQRIVDRFGKVILKPNGDIDRAELSKLVFGNEKHQQENMAFLRSVTWPAIEKLVLDIVAQYKKEGHKVVFVEAALLFEAGWENKLDAVWVVSVPHSLSVERFMKRNSVTREEAEKRLSTQLRIDEMEKRASLVIQNTDDLNSLKNVVSSELDKLLNEPQRILIFKGDTHSCKTTQLQNFVKARQSYFRFDGFIAPSQNNKKYLTDLSTGESQQLEFHKDNIQTDEMSAFISIGNYHLRKSVFEWANKILQSTSALTTDYIVLDEVGPIEVLRKEGFDESVKYLLEKWKTSKGKSFPRIVFVVRNTIFDAFLKCYSLSKDQLEIVECVK